VKTLANTFNWPQVYLGSTTCE